MTGQILGGRYRLEAELGVGGFATVYRARAISTNAVVAVKVLHPHIARQPSLAQRFMREFRVMRELTSPHVARAIEVVQDRSSPPFVVMEYVDGPTVDRLLEQRGGRLSLPEALSLVDQALTGLADAHQRNVIHRDLKLENLMVDRSGTVKVMDFGIARVLGAGTITKVGEILGTVEYMSPEQVAGAQVDHRTDVHAMGIILYELLTGRGPFSGVSDPIVTMGRIRQEVPARVTTIRREIPEAVARVVERALEKHPSLRYRDAGEMRVALAEARSAPPGAGTTAPPAGRATPPRSRGSSGPGVRKQPRKGETVGRPKHPEQMRGPRPKPGLRQPQGWSFLPAIAIVIAILVLGAIFVSWRSGARSGSPFGSVPASVASAAPAGVSGLVLMERFDDTHSPRLPTESREPGQYLRGYRDGVYFIQVLSSATFAPDTTVPGEYANVEIETDAWLIGGVPGALTLACRARGSRDDDLRYGYVVRAAPQARSVVLIRADGETASTELARGELPVTIGDGSTPIRLRLRCFGQTITAFLGRDELARATDATYPRGHISFGASQVVDDGRMVEARFDNLEVRVP